MTIEDVYSRLVEIRRAVLSTKRATSSVFGIHKSRFKGSGFEFASIEEWQQGEPLSNIAWRMSIKYLPDRIFKIRRKESKQMPTDMVIDLTPSMRFQIKEGSNKARLLFEIIGAIGFTSVHHGDPVGAIGYSNEIDLFLKPRASHKHVLHVVRRIFEKIIVSGHDNLVQDKISSKADINIPLNFLYRKYKSRHLVILLSDFIDEINDPSLINWELMRAISARHDVIALILHDEGEFKWEGASGVVVARDLESGRIERVKGSRGLNIKDRVLRQRMELVEKFKQNGVGALAVSHENYRLDLLRFFRSRRNIFR